MSSEEEERYKRSQIALLNDDDYDFYHSNRASNNMHDFASIAEEEIIECEIMYALVRLNRQLKEYVRNEGLPMLENYSESGWEQVLR